MAKFHIKLGPTAKDAEIIVNGRPMLNVVGLSIKQGPEGEPQVSITIPASELVVEGDGRLDLAAPALLRALKAALPQIEPCSSANCRAEGHKDCAYGLVRAAMEKAGSR